MNVARSTLVRRGYLLTALALAVLLAASSGTAWAQSLRFNTSRATVEEGASASDTAAPTPLKVTISRSSSGFDGPDDDNDGVPDARISNASNHVVLSVVEYDGTPAAATIPFTITARSGDSTTSVSAAPGTAFSFGADTARASADGIATTIELTIAHTGDNGDWNDETLVLRLSAHTDLTSHLTNINRTLSYGARELTVTAEDDDPPPMFRFEKADIQLATGNTQTVKVGVSIGAERGSSANTADSIQATLAALDGGVSTSGATGDEVLLAVEPADAVGEIIKITKDVSGTATALVARGAGRYVVGTIGGTAGVGVVTAATGDATDGIELTIEALDASGFRDERISLTLMDGRTEAEKMGEGGPIDDSVPTTVTVLSGAATPTVTFSTDSVTIDEGGMEMVHLLADTDQGDQVGSVAVSVTGDATIVLEQGGNRISNGAVDFGGSANAELTIRALGDLTLEDGEEKMATVTITDAGGANIGDPAELTVTVVGSTAVPVLPLVGQLILALLLTAGGARLYRRRQQ